MTAAALEEEPPLEGAGAVLRSGVPRLLLSAVGPIAGYFVGEQLAGVAGGIVVATVVSLAVYARERRGGRPGLVARITLAVIVLQALLGALAGSAFMYFLPKVAVDLALGIAHYASCRARRPLASTFARELTTLPDALETEPRSRRLFVSITLVWGTYFMARGLVTLLVLATASTETFLLVRTLIDAPLVIALVAASIAVASRRLRAITADRARADALRRLEPTGEAVG
jgi:uncharacterized membrane protein